MRIPILACAALCAAVSAQRPDRASRQGERQAEMPPVTTVPSNFAEQFPWRELGPANMGGRIVDIEVSPNDPSTWWVATASGGILKTTNNGTTFEHQFDREATVSIGAIAVAPSDPNIVWVGTGENNPRNSVS
ncbi:MAG: WD40/YVTN/BNR-like repeat-containing protein, partial [Planctomycetota bacterium]